MPFSRVLPPKYPPRPPPSASRLAGLCRGDGRSRHRVQVTPADDEPGVDAQLFGVLNLGLDRVVAEVGAHADLRGAQLVRDVLRVLHERDGRRIVFRADGDDAHLVRCEPEREVVGPAVAGFDEEADEALVRLAGMR